MGRNGNDILIGGPGADYLIGGRGADRFVFGPGDLMLGDEISDFRHAQGDKMDLSLIDAISGGADDAFTYIGSGNFSGVAGEVHYIATAGGVTVQGDMNGDGFADFNIEVLGVSSLNSTDFIS